jgi:GMP synthase PP-ATPase subunit
MSDEEILKKANEISVRHGLTAELLDGIRSVGVRGDERAYLPVIVLVGEFPGWDVIERVSSEITNTIDVGRVAFESARKTESQS